MHFNSSTFGHSAPSSIFSDLFYKLNENEIISEDAFRIVGRCEGATRTERMWRREEGGHEFLHVLSE